MSLKGAFPCTGAIYMSTVNDLGTGIKLLYPPNDEQKARVRLPYDLIVVGETQDYYVVSGEFLEDFENVTTNLEKRGYGWNIVSARTGHIQCSKPCLKGKDSAVKV